MGVRHNEPDAVWLEKNDGKSLPGQQSAPNICNVDPYSDSKDDSALLEFERDLFGLMTPMTTLVTHPHDNLCGDSNGISSNHIWSLPWIGPVSEEGRQSIDSFGPRHGVGCTALTISRSCDHSMIDEHDNRKTCECDYSL
jgi:hypothetical protein